MQNRICSLFNIEKPIIQAGMIWASGWELAAAVSNAGGLGIIGAGSMYPDVLEEQIKKCQQATSKPFAVNLPLLYPDIDQHIQTIIKLKVPIVFTSAGNPKTYTHLLKEQGIRVVHVVSSSKFALKAQEAGVDAIVAEGLLLGDALNILHCESGVNGFYVERFQNPADSTNIDLANFKPLCYNPPVTNPISNSGSGSISENPISNSGSGSISENSGSTSGSSGLNENINQNEDSKVPIDSPNVIDNTESKTVDVSISLFNNTTLLFFIIILILTITLSYAIKNKYYYI